MWGNDFITKLKLKHKYKSMNIKYHCLLKFSLNMKQPLRYMPQLKGNQSTGLEVRDRCTNHWITNVSLDPKLSEALWVRFGRETSN